MQKEIKRGPKPEFTFGEYPIGHEIKIAPLKQSSFKSLLSKFNKDLPKEERHAYIYEQLSSKILAIRIK